MLENNNTPRNEENVHEEKKKMRVDDLIPNFLSFL